MLNVLDIRYKSRKIEKVCTNRAAAVKEYNEDITKKLYLRLTQIKAADSVVTLMQCGLGRCHELKGNLNGMYAMDLSGNRRLIFSKVSNSDEIEVVRIEDISVDYH